MCSTMAAFVWLEGMHLIFIEWLIFWMIIAGNLKMDAKALLSDHGFLASMIYIQINFNYEYIIELIYSV